MKSFRGSGTALVTPFSNGKVDYAALGAIIDNQINGGVEFLVSLGTTGESATLSKKEKHDVVRYTVTHVNDRVPVVVGISGNNTAVVKEEMTSFDLSGVTAILTASPAYNKPSQEGIYQHYMHLANIAPLPIIIYNVPGRTSSNLSAATTLRLANNSSKFLGIKEASGDLGQSTSILKGRPENFMVWSGDDPTALAHTALGGDGVISVMTNAWPAEFSQLIRDVLNNDLHSAQAANNKLFDLHHWLYIDGNPAGIKAALEIKGVCSDDVRLPLARMSTGNKENLRKIMGQV